ncbi:unnamed protein product [Urochloa humidicola]
MPPPASAAGDLDKSSSSIVGGTVTGHHHLHINCYSRTKEDLPNGQYIDSCPFRPGGSSWHIRYYPNGSKPEALEFVSVFLYLDQSIKAKIPSILAAAELNAGP